MHVEIKAEQHPITVVVSQVVKPGCEPAYEDWIREIRQAAMEFDGHLGANILRPQPGSRPEYVIIFQFDGYRNWKAWMESDDRQRWLTQAAPLVQAGPIVQQFDGLDVWFTLPGQPARIPPPRYKMAMLTWAAVFVLLNLLNAVLVPLLQSFPAFIRTLLVSALMVVLLTYVVLPQMTRLLREWLYPSPSPTKTS